jgi:hypothetical protein
MVPKHIISDSRHVPLVDIIMLNLPNTAHGSFIVRIRGPKRQFILLFTDAHHETIDLVAINEVFSDNAEDL